MVTYPVLDKSRACPIISEYLTYLAQTMSSPDNELMYESKKSELLTLQRRATEAGSGLAVQHLRGFVALEAMSTLLGREYFDTVGLLLGKRDRGHLTRYILWVRATVLEIEADRINYQEYSTVWNRDQLADRAAKIVAALDSCNKSARLLRRSLVNHRESLKDLGFHLYRICEEMNVGMSARLGYASKLLNVTHEYAPRGWEK